MKFGKNHIHILLCTLAFLLIPIVSYAQEDEIQVYDGGIADKGKFNLTLHNNFTPKGHKEPAFEGGVPTDKTLNGVPEWAYGVTRWWEQGLYLPLYSVAKGFGPKLNGFKIRELFVAPNADDRQFVYGVNFEFSYNAKHWDDRRFTSEIRPIIGWHLHPVDLIVNPIVDTSYYGGVKSLEFVPATRVAYNFRHEWAMALEEYSDYGKLRDIVPFNQQAHSIYWVVDKNTKLMDIEAGVGFGLTSASDKLVLKLILSRDLN